MNNEINNNPQNQQIDNKDITTQNQELTTPLPTITPITPTPLNADTTPEITPTPAPVPNTVTITPISPTPTPEGQAPNAGNITPNIVMPEMKNEATPQPETNQQPQLNIETASPFDIGVSAPLNTTVANIEVSNNEPQQVPVNNNVDNSTQQPQNDINIKETSNDNTEEIVSVGKYILHFIIFSIPVIGFIMLIVKALDKKNKNISNLAKAILIIGVISIIIVAITFALLMAMGMSSGITTTYNP